MYKYAYIFLIDSGLTWRPQLGLAGRAGQRQALAQPVHAVEADGDVGLRHGLQMFRRREGNPVGLVGESRLRRAESRHARRSGLRERRDGKSQKTGMQSINDAEITQQRHNE